jgi:hypothetical protein
MVDSQTAYNNAVIAGDVALARTYAQVWLWIIQAAQEARQAAAEEKPEPELEIA